MDVWSYLVGKAKGGGGPSPSGTIEITKNGTYDVTSKATANVNVSGGGSQDFTIENGEKWYNLVDQIDKITINTNNWESLFSGYMGTELPVYEYEGTITNLKNAFYQCYNLKSIDLSNVSIGYRIGVNSLFQYCNKLAVIDISGWDANDMSSWEFTSMFNSCGTSSLQSDGAYADGIAYVYVKDSAMQNWILTKSNGHPSSWSTANVVIKS